MVECSVKEGPVGGEGEERVAHELGRPGSHLRVDGQAVAEEVARCSR